MRVILLEDGETVHNVFSIEVLRNNVMKIKYFQDTDTALMEFADREVFETLEISENIYIDIDSEGIWWV